MRFTVVWWPAAQAELANIWVNAPDKKAVSDAANFIDIALGRAPDSQGEGADEQRTWFYHPLVVHYRISRADCLVEVVRIKYLPTRGKG